MSNAPRYRLVGYDIGTAPDENGGWVHWTDHEAEIARLTADLAESRAYALAQFFAGKMSKKPERIWSRPDYNECWHNRLEEEDVEYVRADLYAAKSAEIARLTAERDYDRKQSEHKSSVIDKLNATIASAAEKAEAERDAALAKAYGPILDLLPDAVLAAGKAMRKYPQPNYVISKWAEETGEVTKDLIHMAEGRQTADKLRGEIVQSLAMLHRLMVEGDQVHGLPPVGPAIRALTPPADLAAKIGGE